MSTNQLVIQGSAQFPPDEGQPAAASPFGYSGTYTSVTDTKLVMPGSGTQVVPFGTVGSPGAKAVVLEYESAQGASPIKLRFNSGTDELELAPGGFFVYASPTPAVGLTSMSIVRTTDATVRVRVFG